MRFVARNLPNYGFSESLIIRPRGERFDRMYLRNLVVRSVVLNNKVSSIDIEGTESCRLHFTFRTLVCR